MLSGAHTAVQVLNFTSEPSLGLVYVAYNMDADLVNDINVRKALSLSIDRKLLCDQVLRNARNRSRACSARV